MFKFYFITRKHLNFVDSKCPDPSK